MNILYVIPARGGSKGVPGKNIKILGNKPLIHYSIDFARKFTDDSNICVSTDDDSIISCVKDCNFIVDFKRPKKISTDHASTIDVLIHAINYYESIGRNYDTVVLLQPTSPFRKIQDLKNMIDEWTLCLDLLVSVKENHDSPYFNIYEENDEGFLTKSKELKIYRRQDAPKVYTFNGSIYIYNVDSIKKKELVKIRKYVMEDQISSIDVDTNFDFLLCQTVIKNHLFEKY